MYLHAFKNNGHPTFAQDEVVLSDGDHFERLGMWDGFDFSSDLFRERVYVLQARAQRFTVRAIAGLLEDTK